MSQRISVHDPRGYPPTVTGKRLAPRLETLDEKIIYLVDCLFDNSDTFMRELADWFGVHFPRTEIRMTKPRESWVDDPEMRAQIEQDGQAAILGVGL